MTDEFPQAVMLVSQNATTCVMVVLLMIDARATHGMSPMFRKSCSSIRKSVSAVESIGDFAGNQCVSEALCFLRNTATSFLGNIIPRPRPTATINKTTQECGTYQCHHVIFRRLYMCPSSTDTCQCLAI